jgi:hypothetical protein
LHEIKHSHNRSPDKAEVQSINTEVVKADFAATEVQKMKNHVEVCE